MAFDILETGELLGVIENIPPRTSYWRDLCFRRVHNSQTEYIEFEHIKGARRLAPFVAPNVQGVPVVSLGSSVRKVKPAYVKMKDPVTPDRVLTKRTSELFGRTQLTPAQREDAIIADIVATHVDMYERRLEWMAARAIIDGAVVIGGENYPEVTVDFKRAGSHTKTLTSTALWTDTTNSKPLENLEDWSLEMLENSGVPLARITFGTSAWKAFIAHPHLKDMLDTNVRGSENSLETGPRAGQYGGQFRGQLKSMNVDLYVYNDKYEDNQGTLVDMMDPTHIVLTGADVDGVQCFGAVMDTDAQYQPFSLFPKMWKQEDPSGLFVMHQGAPLMVPARTNATMRVKVR